MRTAVVTSCSRAGFEKYGLRCLTTLHQFWPTAIDVYLVSEDHIDVPTDLMSGRKFSYTNLLESDQAREFYREHEGDHRAKGMKSNRYDFKFDAWKFSKKVYAIDLIAGRVDVAHLIWVDADVVTFAQVPPNLFDSLPPNPYAIACLDRGNYHSECGFIGYNLNHKMTRTFIQQLARVYSDGSVFGVKEWHDSFVFDWLRKSSAIPTYKIPHRSRSHPFVHSILGKYMDHLKGVQRKEDGKSRDHPRFAASRVLQTRKEHYKARLLARQEKAKAKLQRLKDKHDAVCQRYLAARRGHPLPSNADQGPVVGRQGDLPVEKVAGSIGIDPGGPAERSG